MFESMSEFFFQSTVHGQNSIPSIDKRPNGNRVTSEINPMQMSTGGQLKTILFYFYRHVSEKIRVNERAYK
jgi:hypothetical protein